MTNHSASFEKNMKRLEEIVEKMNGDVALDEALELFEEADKLVRTCQKKLDDAQSRVEKIILSRSDENQVVKEPLKLDSE